MRSVWPVTSTSSSFCTCGSLLMISLSIAALPSGFSTALSKSNSAFEASVIFCTGGAGRASARAPEQAPGQAARGPGRRGAGGLGTRSGSHWSIAIAGVQ